MPTKKQSARAKSKPTATTEASKIARFRKALDWTVAYPEWEETLQDSIARLELKGGRQGISATQALRSLPLEHKFAVVRDSFSRQLPKPKYAEAIRLARLWGETNYSGRADFSPPSNRQWADLRKKILIRLHSTYELYKNAQSSLFLTHSHIPENCAKKTCSSTQLREDALQEARLALLDAIDRVDPNQQFEAYARQWINRRIKNFLMSQRLPVKAPINLISQTLRSAKNGNEALATAIREGIVHLDNPETAAIHELSAIEAPASYAPDQLVSGSDTSSLIVEAMQQLTKKQREVLELRFGFASGAEPISLAKIAEQTGISRQQVFQREKRALQKLHSLLAPLKSECSEKRALVPSY